MKKVKPETWCEKMSQNVCAPSNCVISVGEKVKLIVRNYETTFLSVKYYKIFSNNTQQKIVKSQKLMMYPIGKLLSLFGLIKMLRQKTMTRI